MLVHRVLVELPFKAEEQRGEESRNSQTGVITIEDRDSSARHNSSRITPKVLFPGLPLRTSLERLKIKAVLWACDSIARL